MTSRYGRAVVDRLGIVFPDDGDPWNAINHYSSLLCDALNDEGVTTSRFVSFDDPALEACEAIVIQYNPFAYGRWGVAPQAAVAIRNLRRRVPRATIALTVHEAFSPVRLNREVLFAIWHRIQYRAILPSIDVASCPVEAWARQLSRYRPRRRVEHLPVGANVPDARAHRATVRAEHGLEDALVISALNGPHPSKLQSWVADALRSVAAARPLVFLNLGNGAVRVDLDPGTARVITPGPLPGDALAGYIAASDIFLAPFVDGVSGRRGSVMAALQNGVAVVSTHTPVTDRVFLESDGIRTAAIDDPSEFVQATLALAQDPAARAATAAAGKQLYNAHFDWAVIARRLVELVSSPAGSRDTRPTSDPSTRA